MCENRNSVFMVRICLVAALGGLLFGYDTAVIAGAIGFLQEHFQLDAAMKGWAASSALLGCVIGVSLAGIVSDFSGRKKTLILSAVLFLISAIGTAVPNSFYVFVIYRMIGGVGVGIASMASPMYIAEVSPARIRGRMVSVNQLAIVSGMLLIYFINYFIARGDDQVWNVAIAWRWMFGSESVPAVLFLLLLFGVPESPRWLVEHGRDEHAHRVMVRIGGERFANTELESIRVMVAQEAQSHLSLLTPKMRFVLFLGIMLAVLQQVTGINVFLYYAPEIFKQVGSASDVALLQTIVVGAINLIFTLIAIWTVDRLGRKPLMIVGAVGMGLSLAAMGAASQFQLVAVWVLAFILSYIACFALSVGPVTWVILSEIFPNRIRGRAMSLATLALWSANFLVSQTFPMMDENSWLVAHFNHGFPFYVYAGFCAVLVVIVWLGVPETKGQSLEEIERRWTASTESSQRSVR
ncbi:MAG: sugar porter family MFS transporter [Thermoguttaceae bacterium]